MATFYLDFVNGDDSNDGSSWALAWKTMTSGALASRIAAGDIIKIAKSPDPVAVGNAKWTCGPYSTTTQTPTSSTNASPIVITKNGHGYVDGDILFIRDHTVNTAANGVWEVYLSNANTFALKGSSGNGVGGATGSMMKINAKAVVLSTSGLTKNVDKCEAAWTLANSATVALETYSYAKQGAYIQKVTAPASPAINTLYAYRALGSVIDFSAYQKMSFWIQNEVALAAGNWKLCLCSDTAGATIVDEFEIPAIPSIAQVLPLTITKTGGGNCGASIQSVALYSSSTAPTASKYVRLDNIIACTTSGINLQSLISKNASAQGGTEGWYGIQSIDDMIVLLDNNPTTKVNAGQGYYGTSETVATYIRETVKATIQSSSSGSVGTIQDSGSNGNNIQFQGGYNTATGSQDGETILDYLNGYGNGVLGISKNYITVNHLSVVRAYYGMNMSGGTGCLIDQVGDLNSNTQYGLQLTSMAGLTINNVNNVNNNGAYGVYLITTLPTSFGTFGNVNNNLGTYGMEMQDCPSSVLTEIKNANNNNGTGLFITNSEYTQITTLGSLTSNRTGQGLYITTSNFMQIGTISNVNYNGSSGVYLTNSTGVTIKEISNANSNSVGVNLYSSFQCLIKKIANANSNASYGLAFNGGSWYNTVHSINTAGNTTRAINLDKGMNYVNHAACAEATIAAGFTVGNNARVCMTNFNNDATDHRIYTDGGTVTTDGVTARSGISWKWSFSDSTRGSKYPIDVKIAKVAVEANKAVTVKVYVRRNNDTDAAMKFVIRGGQLAGMPADDLTVTTTSASSGSWEQVTFAGFTPTEKGVIEIEAHGYYVASTSGNVWVDDISIEQAA